MKVTMVLTQGPGSEDLQRLFDAATVALKAGDEVNIFLDVEGVKAMRGTNDAEKHDLSVLERRGARILLCRLCMLRQGLEMDPIVMATARTGDMDDLSRLIAGADRVVCP